MHGAPARRGGWRGTGAAARAGKRMTSCAFPGFWALGVRKIDRLASSAAGLTAACDLEGGREELGRNSGLETNYRNSVVSRKPWLKISGVA